AEYAPRYEDRVLQAPAALSAGAQQGIRIQEVATQSRHYVEQAQQGMRPSEHFDAGPFVPGPPDSPYVRPQRMPQIDDLPLQAQNQIRARRGERGAEPHPEAKRRSLRERLASFGISRQEEAAAGRAPRERQAPARQSVQEQIHPQQQPGPVHAEYAKHAQHPPAPQRAAQTAVDAHGRGAYQARAIEEDQLEIPAFLRRQSSS
ncbi:MAG: cell division protein FtsZ, partial [Methylocella sp.]